MSQHTETNTFSDVNEARRYEYRLKHGRNQLVTTRRVYHELERVPEGAGHVPTESNSVLDRAPIVTAQASHAHM